MRIYITIKKNNLHKRYLAIMFYMKNKLLSRHPRVMVDTVRITLSTFCLKFVLIVVGISIDICMTVTRLIQRGLSVTLVRVCQSLS